MAVALLLPLAPPVIDLLSEAEQSVGMEFETWDVARLKEILRYLRRG